MKPKLRLLLTEKCSRRCKGCCNKDWDLNILPVCESFDGYKEVLITGGEPMLYVDRIIDVWMKCKITDSNIKVYMYTAYISHPNLLNILCFLDGMTITIHTKKDIKNFIILDNYLSILKIPDKSMRLRVFKGIKLPQLKYKNWKIKKDLVWEKNCPLPDGEEFKKYERV